MSLGMRNIVRITVVLILDFLGGCSFPNPATTGNWIFKLTPSGSSEVILATANLTQNGNVITGHAALSGNGVGCGVATSMMASGSVQGNNLTLQFTQAQNIVTFTGTANQSFTFLTGTYLETGGSCLPDGGVGSWSATLQ